MDHEAGISPEILAVAMSPNNPWKMATYLHDRFIVQMKTSLETAKRGGFLDATNTVC